MGMPGLGDIYLSRTYADEGQDWPDPPDIYCENCKVDQVAVFIGVKKRNGIEWAQYECRKCEHITELN